MKDDRGTFEINAKGAAVWAQRAARSREFLRDLPDADLAILANRAVGVANLSKDQAQKCECPMHMTLAALVDLGMVMLYEELMGRNDESRGIDR